MNLSRPHPLAAEKVNDDSSLVAVEHFENFKPKAFSVKKGMVLRHGA
jgi:uncharacterized protein YkvS